MGVKEQIIAKVTGQPAPQEPVEVPEGIKKLLESGIPFVVQPNPNIIMEGVPGVSDRPLGNPEEEYAKGTSREIKPWEAVHETAKQGAKEYLKDTKDFLSDLLNSPEMRSATPEEIAAQREGWGASCANHGPRQAVAEIPHKDNKPPTSLFTPEILEHLKRIEKTLDPQVETPSHKAAHSSLTDEQTIAFQATKLGCSYQVAELLVKLNQRVDQLELNSEPILTDTRKD